MPAPQQNPTCRTQLIQGIHYDDRASNICLCTSMMPILAHQLLHIIKMMYMKNIDGICLLAHNIDEATNSMANKLCIFIYAIHISCDYSLECFIFSQAVTLLTSSISLKHTSTWVWDDEKAIIAHAIVPGQGKDGVKCKWIGCMALLAQKKDKLVPRACFGRCIDRMLLCQDDDSFLHWHQWGQVFVIWDNCNIRCGLTHAAQEESVIDKCTCALLLPHVVLTMFKWH